MVWSEDDGLDALSEKIENATLMIETSPKSTVQRITEIIETIDRHMNNASRKEKSALKRLQVKAQDIYDSARILALIQQVDNHITNLRIAGQGGGDDWQQPDDSTHVMEDNNKAKQFIAKAEYLARRRRLPQFLGEIHRLDDERAFESRAALSRIRDRRIETLASAYGWNIQSSVQAVFVYPICRISGGGFSFSVSVKNTSKYVITDVTVTIVSYPRDCMKISTEVSKAVHRIEVAGFRNVKFDLQATKDCVEGKIIAVVSYIDHRDKLHSIVTDQCVIKSVCDLLQPYRLSKPDFEEQVKSLIGHSRTMQLNWNAETLVQKLDSLLPRMNFHLVRSEINRIGGKALGAISGFALGKYTGKRVAVTIKIIGNSNEDCSTAEVTVSGDDEAMLPTTIDELVEKAIAWTCLRCGAKLNSDQLEAIEAGEGIECKYCNHALTLDLYCKGSHPAEPSNEPSVDQESDSESIEIGTTDATLRPGSDSTSHLAGIAAYRGCETIGSKFEFKVKIENSSKFVITNVTVSIIAYPNDALQVEGDCVRQAPRIEIGGFRSLGFTFRPLKDCVEGKIISVVSYSDFQDQVRLLEVEPCVIKSVCDLLKPLDSSLEDFNSFILRLNRIDDERTYDLNTKILVAKAINSLKARNFSIIDREERMSGEYRIFVIRGLAEGKYTGARIGIVLMISGLVEGRSSIVKIEAVSGEASMLPITIEEIKENIDTWTCLHCGGLLQLEQVSKMKDQRPITCNNCGSTLSIELYRA